MSRVQLALNVSDLDEAVAFYSRLFATEPAKLHPGYANFAVVDPPLKLVLIEDRTNPPGSINHLGVEFESAQAVASELARLAAEDLDPRYEGQVTCCYAKQDKVWVNGPGGEPWEIYTVLAGSETAAGELGADPSEAPCCATRPDLAATHSARPCC